MPFQTIPTFHPIPSDDLPTFTMKLRDMPTGYHLTDIVISQTTHPNTYVLRDKFLGIAERFYRNYEVNAETPVDFLENVQLSYDMKADVFEKMLTDIPLVNIMMGSTVNETRNTLGSKEKENNATKTSSESVTGNNTSTIGINKNNDVTKDTNANENLNKVENLTTKDNVVSAESILTDGSMSENGTSTNKDSKNSATSKVLNNATVKDNDETIDTILDRVENGNENVKGSRSNTTSNSSDGTDVETRTTNETNGTSRNKNTSGSSEVNDVETKNVTNSEIDVSLDYANLLPHSKTINEDNGNKTQNGTTSGHENESTDGNRDVNDNTVKTSSVSGSNSVTESADNQTIKNGASNEVGKNTKREDETVKFDQYENINVTDDSNSSVSNNKSSTNKENVIKSGSDSTDTESVTDINENKTFTNSDVQKTVETVSQSETGNNISLKENSASDTGSETNKYDETSSLTRKTDRLYGENPIDLFDNFFKKYPNLIEIFISFFTDDFTIYERGWF